MCENCYTYNPCISICPKKTCDNRLVYDTLTTDCGQEVCVEGCDIEPCPPGENLLRMRMLSRLYSLLRMRILSRNKSSANTVYFLLHMRILSRNKDFTKNGLLSVMHAHIVSC